MKIHRIVFLVFVLLLFSLPISSIQNNKIVRAAEYHDAQNVIGLNASLMMELATSFSNIIYTAYNDTELPKGRWFGSKGEWAARDIIFNKFTAWGLTSQQEQIHNQHDSLLARSRIGLTRPQADLEVEQFTITHYNISQSQSEQPITEFSVLPQWGIFPLTDLLKKGSTRYIQLQEHQKSIYKTTNLALTEREINRTNLKIWKRDLDLSNGIDTVITSMITDIQLWEEMNLPLGFILDKTMKQMEETYQISFDEMAVNQTNATELPWYNTTIATGGPFVIIGEDYAFNPTPGLKVKGKLGNIIGLLKEMWIYRSEYPLKFRGMILYENQYNNANETYDMNYIQYLPVPLIYINRTKGKEIEENHTYYRINYTLHQEFNNSIKSYNVIGTIGTDNWNDQVLLMSLYDSVWSQGSCDSAIGMSIVMAIANYSRELDRLYNIKPKCNLSFIGFGGEEAGIRGPFNYIKKHKKELLEKNTTVIDLNQLGYNQTWPKQALYIVANNKNDKRKTDFLSQITQYKERTDEYTPLIVKTTKIPRLRKNGIFENRLINILYKTVTENQWTPPSNYLPFHYLSISPKYNINTLCIIKENASKPYAMWRQHHRTGKNYANGDSMNLYNKSFVNVTSELIWNLTRYYAYNPDCEFVTISHQKGDANDDNILDYINISYELDTIMPHDRLTVHARLKNNRRVLPITQQTHYTLGRSGLTGYINITPKYGRPNFPPGNYNLSVYLFNSTGEINLQMMVFTNVVEYLQHYCDDVYYTTEFGMNTMTSNYGIYTPTSNQLTNVKAGTTYTYESGGTNPNNNPVYYQWEFTDLTTNTPTYTDWMGPYPSGTNHTLTHIWTHNGTATIRTRARDTSLTPYDYSNWSEPLTLTIQKGVRFIIPEKVLTNHTFNVTGHGYGINTTNHTWTYTFDQSEGGQQQGQNSSYTYTQNQTNTIYLTVNDTQNNEYEYNKTIHIHNLIAQYSINDNTTQTNQTLYFNDTSIGINTPSTWNWTFDDGSYNQSQNTIHSYTTPGYYNVTLTISDDLGNHSNITTKIIIDNTKPEIITVDYVPDYLTSEDITDDFYPYKIGIGQNITFHADLHDTKSFIETATLNITYPDGTTTNLSMTEKTTDTRNHILQFNDTVMIGPHLYTIWLTDQANNKNHSLESAIFEICHLFGRSNIEKYNKTVEDTMLGTRYKIIENGAADTITAYIQSNETPATKGKCMIYEGGTLVGTTDERNIKTGDDYEWVTFNFTGTKPILEADTEYILFCWSDDKCNITYDNSSKELVGYYRSETYGTPPSPVTWIDGSPPPENKYRTYSIYCSYTNIPEIGDICHMPNVVGFGYNVTISANVSDSSGLDTVGICFEYPNASYTVNNLTMTNTENDTYQFVFSDTWWVGQYNYTIWATDVFGNTNHSDEYSFYVSADAVINICTLYDSYQNGTIINLTDPPGSGSCMVDYELLDNDTVLHFWNHYDNYYINTTSGIQLTNHKGDYWSHNILMLGWYDNDQWKKLYRTDELTGFTMDIDDTNTDYLNITFWKNVVAKGYPVRLAIRYHLGYDDNELTIIPYIKNLGSSIPYQLGFGWEFKDIQIGMTTTGDYIDINQTTYYLNQTLNTTYSDLDPVMFQIQEDISDDTIESLYLRWNENLSYTLQIKSRDGQYNAPVTLFIKIGTLAAGQEKHTKMFWYDASQTTYYFDDYDSEEWNWEIDPENMADGTIGSYASTGEQNDIELLTSNSLTGEPTSTISKIEIRAYGYDEAGDGIIYLRPVFDGSDEGSNHDFNIKNEPGWSQYFDITSDTNAPGTWSWSDVANLDCVVESIDGNIWYCSKVEVRVSHNTLPSITNPVPVDNSEGISITPVLNITVSDPNGDSMTVTWLSNSSGSWQTFGTNNSVSNGTYHQTFSNATVNGQWWYWKVQVNDGTSTKTSSIYKFYTGYQSKLANTGSYDCLGYLYMDVQWYNTSSGNWTSLMNIIYDGVPRNLSASGENQTIAFDTMVNGLFNSSILWYYGTGTYRFYVAFISPYDEVLVTDDETVLEATYEFTITFD